MTAVLLLNTVAVGYGFYLVHDLSETVRWITAPQIALNADRLSQRAPLPEAGDPNPALRVELYSDFACPACQASIPAILAARDHFGRSIEWVYRPLPHPDPDGPGFHAALLSTCLEDDGDLWNLLGRYDSSEITGGRAELEHLAVATGLDLEQVRDCVRSPAAEGIVWEAIFEAASRGIAATPTIRVAGTEISGQMTEEELIALLRSKVVEVESALATTS